MDRLAKRLFTFDELVRVEYSSAGVWRVYQLLEDPEWYQIENPKKGSRKSELAHRFQPVAEFYTEEEAITHAESLRPEIPFTDRDEAEGVHAHTAFQGEAS
jgi:hypothetical protein